MIRFWDAKIFTRFANAGHKLIRITSELEVVRQDETQYRSDLFSKETEETSEPQKHNIFEDYGYDIIHGFEEKLRDVLTASKGDGISFNTPTIEGTIMRRNKPDGKGGHPWKAEVTEGDVAVKASTITEWYDEVYEPNYIPVLK